MSINILVVEDEADIRRFVRQALEHEGYQVHESADGRRAVLDAGTRRPDLIIVDLGLPDMDGADVIREVRSFSQVPIIVLSARDNETDKVAALDAGADDYLSKPFGVAELLARVRASLRRVSRAGVGIGDSPLVTFGDVSVDIAARRVLRAGEEVHLTQIEYRLLIVLLSHPDRVLTQRHLLKEVWGPGHLEQGHYLRIYMGHLRQKLEVDPTRPRHFKTETGIGYRFVP